MDDNKRAELAMRAVEMLEAVRDSQEVLQDAAALLVLELEKTTPEQLQQLHDDLRRQLHILEDRNSSFPATKQFLEARGLTNVRELDKKGKKDLQVHLEKLYAELLLKNKA